MIDYGDFQFAALPETEVVWFLWAMEAAGYYHHPSKDAYEPFQLNRIKPILRVSLITHPYQFLYNLYEKSTKTHTDNFCKELITTAVDSDEFSEFLERYLIWHPGEVTRLFYLYDADTFLRQEDFPWSIREFDA